MSLSVAYIVVEEFWPTHYMHSSLNVLSIRLTSENWLQICSTLIIIIISLLSLIIILLHDAV